MKRPKPVKWLTPPIGKMKLNIDGASKVNPGPSGCGVIIHDHLGQLIHGFSLFLGVGTNVHITFSN